MPATNYTPIQLYRTNTASTTAPSAVNLNAGELALNYNDSGMILYAKNTTGSVIKLMNNPANLLYPTADGSSGQIISTNGSATLSFIGAGNATANLGYLNIPQNSQSTDYTLVIGDSGKHILHPSADTSARTFTIPANSSVAFPIGTAITFVNQNGAGVITIAITTDTMRLSPAGTTGSRTLAANGVATCIKLTSTEWIISGSGLT
jgi:hypothetical protein